MTTRRAWLARVAAVGGAGAALTLLAAMRPVTAAGPRPSLPPLAGQRVLVLGAGIAGLVAALELHRAGASITVLEADRRIGGRSLTIREGFSPGQYFNAGPARIPQHHAAILGYAREFAVPMQVLVNDNRAAPLPGTSLGEARANLQGVVAELALKALGAGLLEQPITPAELERLAGMLRGFGALDAAGRWRGSARAGWQQAPGMAPGTPRPPLPLAVLLRPGIGQAVNFAEGINYAATMLAPAGGMDMIARALAAALPAGAIRLGAAVAGLDPTAGLVRLADGRVLGADHIICALPPRLAARLDGWSAPRRAALAAVPQENAAKFGLEAPRFWEAQGLYGGIAWLPGRMSQQLWYPSERFHSPRGVLVGAYIWDDALATRFGALSPAQRRAAVLADAAPLHPELAGLAGADTSVVWSDMPWAGAAWAEWTDAARAALLPELLRPEGRVRLAGDWLSSIPGWQEGAVTSAWQAVGALGG
jgi:monoamine oxidase